MPEFVAAGTALSRDGLNEASQAVDLALPEIWSVLSVETSGCGFLSDRRPKILFERHIFHRLTGGRFDGDDPDVSQPSAGGYGPSGAHQYERLAAAMQLDREAALQSASWGLGQIMGENFGAAGFTVIENLVTAMVESEDKQLLAMAKFITANRMAELLRDHDWKGFARRYNGPNYAAHNYDGLLEHFYNTYANGDLPDLDVRAAQVYLTYKSFSPGPVDGRIGRNTETAIRRFQQSKGLPQTGVVDSALISQLLS